MYFRAKTMPEVIGMSPPEVKALVLAATKQGPKWVSYVQAALLLLFFLNVTPRVIEALFPEGTSIFVEILVSAPLVIAFGSILWVAQLNIFVRPEIRRICGPEPNNALHQTGER